jgi:hypothetical protein
VAWCARTSLVALWVSTISRAAATNASIIYPAVVVWQVFAAGNFSNAYKIASVTKSLTSIVAHAVGIPPETHAHTLLPPTWGINLARRAAAGRR